MDYDSLYQQFDLSEIENKFEALFPTWDVSFRELFMAVINGNGAESFIEQGKIFCVWFFQK